MFRVPSGASNAFVELDPEFVQTQLTVFERHEVAHKGFDPFARIQQTDDFLAFVQLERLQATPRPGEASYTEWSPVLEEIMVVHNRQLQQQRFFLDKPERSAAVAKNDYRFRAAALIGCCWTQAPWAPEATEFLLLFMLANGPEARSMKDQWGKTIYPEPWKIHSPMVDCSATAEWFKTA